MKLISGILRSKVPFIRIAILLGNAFIPLYALGLLILFGVSWQAVFISVFFSGSIIERAWETFKTSKERKREELHGDWTLVLVTYTYILLNIAILSEFFLVLRQGSWIVTGVGVLLFFLAMRLRWWGMAALGSQWAIHAVGARKILRTRLVRLGPYRFIRHPIYLAIIFEEASLCLIGNAVYAWVFYVLVCAPMVFLRAWVEEHESVRRFGENYRRYQAEVSGFLPIKHVARAIASATRRV